MGFLQPRESILPYAIIQSLMSSIELPANLFQLYRILKYDPRGHPPSPQVRALRGAGAMFISGPSTVSITG